ncbi:hypothetical protein AAHH67_23170 [Niallia circulans]
MENNHVTATETSMYMEAAKKKKKRRTTQWTWYIFLIPSFLGILLFMVYPVVESFRLSFFKSNGTIESFTGLDNFRTVLTSGPFWNAVWNTFLSEYFKC